MADEQVFTVAGSVAEPAAPVSLSEIGLTERSHLQEWVLAHPSILGSGIRIVTFEFDRWWSTGGNPLDRLDVLGLDRSGQLVVAELKRDAAPDTIEMQAIKYAAMASRFTPDSLASQHARFLTSRGSAVTDEEALNALEEHTEAKSLTVETLRQPRIVLLAASFPPVVTATAVWLREMSINITLVRFQAYRTATETLVTVSQLLPPPTVEEFTVIPRSNVPSTATQSYPTVAWTEDDYTQLAKVIVNPGVRGVLDLCATRPGQEVGYSELVETTGRDRSVLRSDLAGLTMMVKRRFGRINWPFDRVWNTDLGEAFYSMNHQHAQAWIAATSPEEPQTMNICADAAMA